MKRMYQHPLMELVWSFHKHKHLLNISIKKQMEQLALRFYARDFEGIKNMYAWLRIWTCEFLSNLTIFENQNWTSILIFRLFLLNYILLKFYSDKYILRLNRNLYGKFININYSKNLYRKLLSAFVLGFIWKFNTVTCN